jgi:hypothetical protein
MANISKIKIDGTSYSLTDDTKVPISSVTNSVYTTGTSTGSIPYSTESNISGSLIQRDGDGQAFCESGTGDKNIVNYSQMVDYVSEHGGSGSSVYHWYSTGADAQSVTISDTTAVSKINNNFGIIVVNGYVSYSSGTVPFTMVIQPFKFGSSTYNPKYKYFQSFNGNLVGLTADKICCTLTYNTSSITLKVTLYNGNSENTGYGKIYKVHVYSV